MEIIRLLIQNLIVIVVLAVLLEILLPTGEMKRYVKLVVGLLVIITVLGALGSLFRGGWTLALPEQVIGGRQAGSAALTEIMASAEKLSAAHRTRALEEYRRSLARQVSALAGLSGEVAVLSAEVDVYTEENNPKFGQVKQIRIVMKNAQFSGGKHNPVTQPVKISVGERERAESEKTGSGQLERTQPLPAEVINKLKTTIANFYNLSPEQVQVIEGS
ncbi:MAG: stage III sporulation protein AF [Bacillota bacterium]